MLQAEISIGSGGFAGRGFTHGTQTQLDYLRTQTTDYIFSVGADGQPDTADDIGNW